MVVLILFILAFPLQASQKDLFGLGGQGSARVGSITASAENPYAAHTNPAALGAYPLPTFEVSTLWAQTSFSELRGVRLDSPTFVTQNGVERSGDFSLPVQQQALWSLSLNRPFRLPWPLQEEDAGFGIVLSGPYDRLRSFEARTPYDFSTLRYGTSDNQFKATSGLGFSLFEDRIRVGGALTLFFTSTGVADVALLPSGNTSRMALDIGLNTALVLGTLVNLPSGYKVGLVHRQAIHPQFSQTVRGGLQAGDLRFSSGTIGLLTTLYDEPTEWEGDIERSQGDYTFSLGASLQDWKTYQPATIEVRTGDSGNAPLPPPLSMTVSPRASVVWEGLDEGLQVALGYRFRPSPLRDLTGPWNLLDADTHVLGLAFDYRWHPAALEPAPVQIGASVNLQYAPARQVTKTDPASIGSPGYTFSILSMAYGIHFQMPM